MYLDEYDVVRYVVIFGIVVAMLGWPFGIYYFGAEAYVSDWATGPVIILCFWLALGLPVLFVGGVIVAFINAVVLAVVLEVIDKD